MDIVKMAEEILKAGSQDEMEAKLKLALKKCDETIHEFIKIKIMLVGWYEEWKKGERK